MATRKINSHDHVSEFVNPLQLRKTTDSMDARGSNTSSTRLRNSKDMRSSRDVMRSSKDLRNSKDLRGSKDFRKNSIGSSSIINSSSTKDEKDNNSLDTNLKKLTPTISLRSLPGNTLISDDNLKLLLSTLIKIEENSLVLEIVASQNYLFNSEQLIRLLEVTTSIKTKIEIIGLISPKLTDPKYKFDEILNMFRYQDEKEKVSDYLMTTIRQKNSLRFTKQESFKVSLAPIRKDSRRSAYSDTTEYSSNNNPSLSEIDMEIYTIEDTEGKLSFCESVSVVQPSSKSQKNELSQKNNLSQKEKSFKKPPLAPQSSQNQISKKSQLSETNASLSPQTSQKNNQTNNQTNIVQDNIQSMNNDNNGSKSPSLSPRFERVESVQFEISRESRDSSQPLSSSAAAFSSPTPLLGGIRSLPSSANNNSNNNVSLNKKSGGFGMFGLSRIDSKKSVNTISLSLESNSNHGSLTTNNSFNSDFVEPETNNQSFSKKNLFKRALSMRSKSNKNIISNNNSTINENLSSSQQKHLSLMSLSSSSSSSRTTSLSLRITGNNSNINGNRSASTNFRSSVNNLNNSNQNILLINSGWIRKAWRPHFVIIQNSKLLITEKLGKKWIEYELSDNSVNINLETIEVNENNKNEEIYELKLTGLNYNGSRKEIIFRSSYFEKDKTWFDLQNWNEQMISAKKK